MRAVVVDDDLLYLNEVSRKTILVNATFDVSSASVVPTATGYNNQIEDSPLELQVYLEECCTDVFAEAMDEGQDPLLTLDCSEELLQLTVIVLEHLADAHELTLARVDTGMQAEGRWGQIVEGHRSDGHVPSQGVGEVVG